MSGKKKSFEESLARLGEIVKNLEQGQASLAQSLELFEEGTVLVKNCSEMLDTAEQQVVKLKKSPDGTPEELPFDEE